MNYHFSKDYELLWELAQKQEVICAINDRLVKARKKQDNTALVDGDGFCYSDTDNMCHFIGACEYYKVRFLIPGEVDELVEALKEIYKEAYNGNDVRVTGMAKELLKKYEVENELQY